MRHLLHAGLLIAVLPLISCTDPAEPRIPTSITAVEGVSQSAVVATSLSQPVVVEVKDADGRPVRGAAVTWTVASGGGSVNAATTSTNRSGRAQVEWTLGVSAGEQRLSALVTGVAPVSITAFGTPGTPASITVLSGNGQSGIVSVTLPVPLVVRVLDEHGNRVPGATVSFAPSSGLAAPTTATSSDIGTAQTTWTLGPSEGDQTLAAGVAGVTDSARFTAAASNVDAIPVLQNDVPVSGLTAAMGSMRYFRIPVPEFARRLTITLTGGTGDVDLYVRRNTLPGEGLSDCASMSPIATETCVVQSPQSGEWFILLHAYSTYSNVILRATYVLGGSMMVTVAGLPAGAPAGVTVAGPGNYNRTVTATETIEDLIPGAYTVAGLNVLHGGTVYNATPETQLIEVTGGAGVNAVVSYTPSAGGLNLDITGAYITQSVQRANGSIPLIAGRDGLLRVFARANAINDVTPGVRVRLYRDGALADTRTIPASTSQTPVLSDDGVLATTWNVVLPGSLILPGMSLLVDVDPDNVIVENDEADNTWPASGTPMPLTVRTAPVMRARLVPVLQEPNQLLGDVTSANANTYVTDAAALYPLPSVDVDVREPYTFSGVLSNQYDAVWSRLLSEMWALRSADGSDRYYYGVIKPAYNSGGTGLGYIGFPASIGVEWVDWRALTVAHEWGHNFGRQHVGCGNPANPDPNYPYAGGALGQHGWDVRSNSLRLKEGHYDLMSYCQPGWASDYTYEAVMAFRGTTGAPASVTQPSLLVWGRIAADGSAVLEPAFEVDARPMLPSRPGAYRVTGRNAAGETVLDLSFDAMNVDHIPGERHFAFVVPLSSMRSPPSELRLSGNGANVARRESLPAIAAEAGDDVRVTRETPGHLRVRWNAARNPVLMVRDPATGDVLSFARGGDVRIATGAREVEVNLSNGVRSSARRITVSQ